MTGDKERRIAAPIRPVEAAPGSAKAASAGGLRQATNSGVRPYCAPQLTSAPLSSNSRAASTWPFWQRCYSGVRPSSVARSTAAPLSSNSRAASTWSGRRRTACPRGTRRSPSHACKGLLLGKCVSPRGVLLLPAKVLAGRRYCAGTADAGLIHKGAPTARIAGALATQPAHKRTQMMHRSHLIARAALGAAGAAVRRRGAAARWCGS